MNDGWLAWPPVQEKKTRVEHVCESTAMVQQRQVPARHLVLAPAVLFQITCSIAVRTVPAHTDIRSELEVDLVPETQTQGTDTDAGALAFLFDLL
jgi:hypothetical protein